MFQKGSFKIKHYENYMKLEQHDFLIDFLFKKDQSNTWREPFHRPVPRTLEEHHFITSNGLSLDLACHMYPCGLANLY